MSENSKEEIKIEVVNGEGIPVEEKPKETIKDLGEKLKERGGDVLENGLHAVDNLQKNAAPYFNAFTSGIKAGVSRFKEKMAEQNNSLGETAEKVNESAENATEAVKETVANARENLAHVVDDAPLPDNVKENLNKDI